MCKSFAKVSPAMRASYSASLLVVLNPHLMDLSMTCSVGEVSTIPSPLPLALLDPSTAKLHSSLGVSHDIVQSSSSARCRIPGVKSAMKSASTCDLIAVRGW
ncbi:hypothetical protein ACOSQ2_024390 [Xanthoceras sorbifolium]